MSNGAPPPPPAAPPPPSAPPPHVPPQSAPPRNDGLPTWAKVAIGCGCVTLIVAVALFVGLGFLAKKGVDKVKEFENNPAALIDIMPGLEVVEDDKEAGKITIRNTETGEVATFDYSEIKQGRFSFEDGKGERYDIDAGQTEDGGFEVKSSDGEFQLGGAGNLDKVPDWVPRIDGALDTQAAMTLRQSGKSWGTVTQTLSTDLATAADEVEALLTDAGFEVERSEITMGDTEVFQLAATQPNRTINAMIQRGEGGKTTATLVYEGTEQE